MGGRTFVVGVGMTKFEKPGSHERDYPEMAAEAGGSALADARLTYGDIQQAFAGFCYGESTSGQRALYELGMTSIPVVNVNNNCSTGSTALFLARQAVSGGDVDCALALGFEKMEKGAIGMKYHDRAHPIERHIKRMAEAGNWGDSPIAPQMFGNAGREHMELYGSTPEHYAWIAWKNHKHSQKNPDAQFQTAYTIEEISDSREIHSPLTKLQCSPTSDGAAAAVVVSESFVEKHDLWDRAIEIAGQGMSSDPGDVFDEGSSIKIVGFDMSRIAAERAFEQAQMDASDTQVIELHDCFSTNELLSYEALGMAEVGEGHKLVDAKDTTYGGRWVVNPSGGLISKGHPLGATGLAQCAELTWQLRGEADKRQVTGAKAALQHNIGLGGAAVVTMYRKPA